MRIPVALAAAGLVALAAAAPAAQAEPTPAQGLFLTVTGDENTWIRGVLLQCPAGGPSHHPDAGAACAALDAAGGDLDVLAGDPHPCTREFAPVTVGATGTWHGRPTAWHKTYANACMLQAATGPVFHF
ncbi:SSI family serine proteinase inhibitor [Streptomyces beijiangensis]|uniref:Protease inhibitor SIL-V5 n=1 Tax=Streptomyces beijiangensis TaxID=163361 RepID=A0A939JGJ3_9ACTN|nr:SSI family serine proteinase inhibitor [Streptomyces beijiangensis]MBO0511145.1 protease inhibitor SIL-V5 [Streptomyces beijiangensis]